MREKQKLSRRGKMNEKRGVVFVQNQIARKPSFALGDEVDLEAEGEEAALLTNGPAYYNMFLDLEEEECVKPKVKKRRVGSTTLFQKYVLAPTTLEHANQQGNEYAMTGLAGAVGSMDATHGFCHKMKRKLRQSHLGLKLNGTAKTYNLVCNHRRRILSTTTGHPARWNDKTIVKFDSVVMGLFNGDNLADVPFEL
ncbi:hypothetical protein IV203_021545 [Nitzschia inconspicua]|uniref:Uncharacterized protein n=1 Tax=Nitzschia inconspicua TaxID=303405 RepID=A0A9K3PE23_9STRA|nr:hypothetical protein IV203_021545 [Nitzschia inconspicua]